MDAQIDAQYSLRWWVSLVELLLTFFFVIEGTILDKEKAFLKKRDKAIFFFGWKE